MKSFFQLILLTLMIIIGFTFYKSYFVSQKNDQNIINNNLESVNNLDTKGNNNLISTPLDNEIKNNLIKNLRYKVDFSESGQYEISSNLSELNYNGNQEIVIMSDVNAKIIDKNSTEINIVSDEAVFNADSYYTSFKDNIKIEYLKNVITSDKLDFYFDKNIIIISKNIIYKGSNTVIKADNIKINLLTKKIEFFMDNPKKKLS